MGYHTYESYSERGRWSGVNPLASTTYYIGDSGILSVGQIIGRVYIPRSGVIRAVYVNWYNNTQDSTTEATSFAIMKNGATASSTIYSGSFANANSPQSATNLNFAVSRGDYIFLRIVAPAWVTVPLATYLNWVVEIQC